MIILLKTVDKTVKVSMNETDCNEIDLKNKSELVFFYQYCNT